MMLHLLLSGLGESDARYDSWARHPVSSTIHTIRAMSPSDSVPGPITSDWATCFFLPPVVMPFPFLLSSPSAIAGKV